MGTLARNYSIFPAVHKHRRLSSPVVISVVPLLFPCRPLVVITVVIITVVITVVIPEFSSRAAGI